MKGAEDVLTTELQIGSISISLLNILMFIIILSVTYLIAIFIKKILENEILRSLKLPRGMPAAVSMMLRIFFVTLGVIFAISAAGIDMGKFGMIAGALGVGIGFGLQNIVQNFISGLILIFERPIQVGDTVEVNNLLGKVKDIGVRASNVLTYDGAEVVVPNSNLISNDLINWTLSDSRKRVEIKVGTAYGTDPNEVLEILKNVAMSHSMVVQNPEPLALFDGFGDSSLDFRLLFWVNFEFGLTTKSDIAIGIYNKFAENNIEIPFPQIDMHVKDIAETKKDVAKAKKVKSDKVIEPRIEKGNPDLLESDDS
jgi:small-conductance mechanosensitive channel